MLAFAERTKLVNKSLTSFVHYYMGDPAQRLILYQRWTTMRMFSPNLKRLKKIINKHKIKTRMMFGKYDRIIPLSGGQRFLSGIEENATLKVVDLTHHLLNQGTASSILQLFDE